MNIKPLFDKVVLQPNTENTSTTSSGIILKSNDQEKPTIAKVVAVGPGGVVDGENITMQVKKGDVVLYSKYSGAEFTFDKQDYIIIKQSDILAVLENK